MIFKTLFILFVKIISKTHMSRRFDVQMEALASKILIEEFRFAYGENKMEGSVISEGQECWYCHPLAFCSKFIASVFSHAPHYFLQWVAG